MIAGGIYYEFEVRTNEGRTVRSKKPFLVGPDIMDAKAIIRNAFPSTEYLRVTQWPFSGRIVLLQRWTRKLKDMGSGKYIVD